TEIHDNAHSWQRIAGMTASLRILKPSLTSVDLILPHRSTIEIAHNVAGYGNVKFQLNQESEGFRRLLACLIAVNQEPPKGTLFFDEPEKGINPAGLAILADEFQGYATRHRGQVVV